MLTLQERAIAELRRPREASAEERAAPGYTHWRLVQAMAYRLAAMKLRYSTSGPVDLAATGPAGFAFYEMKTIDPQAKNYCIQARQAVAQLYEYRYRAGLPQAKLCLVTNAPLPEKMHWLLAYLEHDRGIGLLWTEDYEIFDGSPRTRQLMSGFC